MNESFTYDHNGNIVTLQRYQCNAGTAQQIDNLSYTYGKTNNVLTKVNDGVSGTAGFSDGANVAAEYSYDADGNLTSDKNKGIDSIKYNALGKACRIKFSDGRLVVYTYDGGGNKLKMATTVSGTTTTTDYVGGFVYSNSTLSFFGSPEGRVVKNGSALEYQYSIADHQGNTRIVFTSAKQTVTAGFETANQAGEGNNFSNYPTSSHIDMVAMNAHGGSNSLHLNGGTYGQVGVAKSYKVYPGDTLTIQAYAKYNTPTTTGSNLAGFATALLNAFNLPAPVGGETGTASSAIGNWGGLEAGGFGDGTNDQSDPKVFVTIVIFDKSYNYLDVAFSQLTSAGSMKASYAVKQAGYAFMYVSNEQQYQTDVYIDDVTMSYSGRIIQSNDYYAHGLQHNTSWTRDNNSNNQLYNEASELNTTTNWYDLPARNYDAALGRFHQVDPLAHYDHVTSPFAYAGNNPIMKNDPTGLYTAPMKDFGFTNFMGSDGLNEGYADWSESGAEKMEREKQDKEDDKQKVRDGRMSVAAFEQKYLGYTTNAQAWIVGSDGENGIEKRTISLIQPDQNKSGYRWDIKAQYYDEWNGNGRNSEALKEILDGFGQILNVGGVFWGGSEIGINTMRQGTAAKDIGRFLGFGTQRSAAALTGTMSMTRSVGGALGHAGFVLSAYSYGSQLLDPEQTISTATHVNFGVSTVLYGGALVAAGTAAAPFVATGALIYGGAQLVSWAFTGNTLEENIFGK